VKLKQVEECLILCSKHSPHHRQSLTCFWWRGQSKILSHSSFF